MMEKYEKIDILKLQVFHAGFWLPICHLEIWNTWNKQKSPQDIKERISIFEEVTEKEAGKERPRMRHNSDKA